LAAMSPLPDAVLCSGDLIALGVLAALGDRGIQVPEDVAMVGFDGVADGAFSRPRLTTIAHPIADMVEQGIDALFHLMALPDASPQRVTLTPRLIVRESCGAALAVGTRRHASPAAPGRSPGGESA